MKNLRSGDKVTIISLSSGLLGEKSIEKQREIGIKNIKNIGLVPIFTNNALKGIRFIKMHPELRAEDLKNAFYDKTIKMILSAIGGFDSYKILPCLFRDKKFIKYAKKHPKIFAGYSDSTISHLFFYKIGIKSYYGINFLVDFAEHEGNILPFTKKNILKLFSKEKNMKINSSEYWYEDRKDYSEKQINIPRIFHKETRGFEILRKKAGKISGKLLGGCLESLYSIINPINNNAKEIFQKYDIFPTLKQWKNKILFIETAETKSSPKLYLKMLEALKELKVLSVIKGIIVGKPIDEIYYDKYKEILIKVTKEYDLPIIYNLNFGHALPHLIIPYGRKMIIDFDKEELTLKNGLF